MTVKITFNIFEMLC